MPTSAAAIYFLFGCVFYYIYEGNIVCESARAKNESRSRHRTLPLPLSDTHTPRSLSPASKSQGGRYTPRNFFPIFMHWCLFYEQSRNFPCLPSFVSAVAKLLFKSAVIDSDFYALFAAHLARHLKERRTE
jgi:hypothetical protein